MALRILAATAASLTVLAAASAASAAIVVVATEKDNLFGDGSTAEDTALLYGQSMLYDFDAILNVNLNYAGNVDTGPKNPITNSAPPPYINTASQQDETNYASVQANQTGALTTLGNYRLTSFSFYLGSPDTYNRVTFYNGANVVALFNGEDIWDASTFTGTANGDRSWGYRVYYDFGGAKVDKITFDSFGSDAMEFDGLAGTLTVVPEPSAWALMILGFGFAGGMLRSQRRRIVAA